MAEIVQRSGAGVGKLQLLQITVSNVMAAPVRDSIELNAMGELHFVLPVKPLNLLRPLRLSFLYFCRLSLTLRNISVVNKLELEAWECGSTCRNRTPFSCQPG